MVTGYLREGRKKLEVFIPLALWKNPFLKGLGLYFDQETVSLWTGSSLRIHLETVILYYGDLNTFVNQT